MAIASKMDNLGCRVYCILGDGEIEEGQIWEAAMTSNKYELDNLCVILDNNGLQIDGKVEEVEEQLAKLLEEFNMRTSDVNPILAIDDVGKISEMIGKGAYL